MGIGCHIIRKFIACILFADDMSLIAPTRASLNLLNACADYCYTYCLKFNVGKTQVMLFGRLNASEPKSCQVLDLVQTAFLSSSKDGTS